MTCALDPPGLPGAQVTSRAVVHRPARGLPGVRRSAIHPAHARPYPQRLNHLPNLIERATLSSSQRSKRSAQPGVLLVRQERRLIDGFDNGLDNVRARRQVMKLLWKILAVPVELAANASHT